MKIALISHGLKISPRILEKQSLGGSETALLQAGQALAKGGARVDVFANCSENWSMGSVRGHDLSRWPEISESSPYDLLIVSRFYDFFDRRLPAGTKILWLHDIIDRPEKLTARLDRLDYILCLSRFHHQDTAARVPRAEAKLILTKNGLDLNLINRVRRRRSPRRPNQLVYASRPERGLGLLLEKIWPILKTDRPDLELKVCGYSVDRSDLPERLVADYRRLDRLMDGAPGVEAVGGLPKEEFYNLLARSAGLIYPCTFAETSCLVALEAQALGTPLIASDSFALSESVVEPSFLVPGRPGSAGYVDRFIDRTKSLLADPDSALRLAEAAGELVRRNHDWVDITAGWLAAVKDRQTGRTGAGVADPADPPTANTQEETTSPPILESNRAALAAGRPDLLTLAEAPGSGRNRIVLQDGPKGWPLLQVVRADGRRSALASAYNPLAEADRMLAGIDFSQAELVVVIGLGLGYHLEAVAARLPEQAKLAVIETGPEIFRAALAVRDFSALLTDKRITWIIDPDSDRALARLGRLEVAAGLPKLTVIAHQPSIAARPEAFGLLPDRLLRAGKVDLGRKLKYPKFKHDQVKVLVLHGKYFLITELRNSLTRMGHAMELVMIRDEETASDEVMSRLIKTIIDFKPDFVLTINHLGFDRDGVLTGFLEQIQMPFASWYVDSPMMIIRHFQENRSPWLSIFLWDSDYIREIKDLGYDQVHYLPLGTDDSLFRPYAASELTGADRFGLSFVGNSMTNAAAKQWARLGLDKSMSRLVDRAAELYAARSDHQVRPALEQAGLLAEPSVAGLDEPGLIDLETLILWRATQLYRLEMIRALADHEPTIAGDEHWQDMIDSPPFRLHPPVNYYDQLPAFYNASLVNFNATSLQMKSGLNQRVFDVPACGRFLLTDRRAQLDRHFKPGKEAVTYGSAEEARDLAGFYLTHESARRAAAEAARARVMNQHTYIHRLTEMIDLMRRRFR